MTKPFFLVANWKMHFTPSEAASLYREFGSFLSEENPVHLWVSAPAISLPALGEAANPKIPFGSQNVHFEDSGAFTGEISVPMVKSVGGTFTLVGHSERRTLFHEEDDLLTKRALGALHKGLKVVFCVGETLEEREGGKTEAVLKEQLQTVIPLFQEFPNALVVAYEPVWAIGTGKVASEEEIQSAHSAIKTVMKSSSETPLPVLYGGSVKPENIQGIAALPDVNGALVGGASLKKESFQALYEKAAASL